ncbi:hypothetical protein Tco_0702160 [Tanacetum coccineum]|uniref:Uncharacterized protein n=1 Tax=Tanacetum coccineum TaxID=301880 RepID=A0ABQ4XV71_9ASTR
MRNLGLDHNNRDRIPCLVLLLPLGTFLPVYLEGQFPYRKLRDKIPSLILVPLPYEVSQGVQTPECLDVQPYISTGQALANNRWRCSALYWGHQYSFLRLDTFSPDEPGWTT